MRAGAMRRAAVLSLAVLGVACSKKHAAPAPVPSAAPSATTLSGAVVIPSASVSAAAAVGSATVIASAAVVDAGPRSLAGKKVLHVGDSMVGGAWGLTR